MKMELRDVVGRCRQQLATAGARLFSNRIWQTTCRLVWPTLIYAFGGEWRRNTRFTQHFINCESSNLVERNQSAFAVRSSTHN